MLDKGRIGKFQFVAFCFRKVTYEREVYNEELWRVSWDEVQQNQIASQIVRAAENVAAARFLDPVNRAVRLVCQLNPEFGVSVANETFLFVDFCHRQN